MADSLGGSVVVAAATAGDSIACVAAAVVIDDNKNVNSEEMQFVSSSVAAASSSTITTTLMDSSVAVTVAMNNSFSVETNTNKDDCVIAPATDDSCVAKNIVQNTSVETQSSNCESKQNNNNQIGMLEDTPIIKCPPSVVGTSALPVALFNSLKKKFNCANSGGCVTTVNTTSSSAKNGVDKAIGLIKKPGVCGGANPSIVGSNHKHQHQLHKDAMDTAEDIRKKRRCTDRYDSSESSDSGVATLSCTDSSTASSDASDPGSPYSPSSSCDDNNHQTSNSTAMGIPLTQPNEQTTAAPQHNWPWSNNFSPTKNLVTVNTINVNNNKIKRTSTSVEGSSVASKKVRSCSVAPSTVATSTTTSYITTDKPLALVAAAPKPTSIPTISKVKPHVVIADIDPPGPQTKITGYFKSQIKPLNGIKKDLTNLVVRSTDFPKTGDITKSTKAIEIRAALTNTMPPTLRKVERKTAKVAPLVPISRRQTTNSAASKRAAAMASPKKPVTIAPRTAAIADSANKRTQTTPTHLMPKLQDIKSHSAATKSMDQLKLVAQQQQHQPTVLLTAIRIPPQQQVVAPLQQQQQNVQAKAQNKITPVFQLHPSAPAVMPKLVQIPNILTKDSNLVMNNNGQITRMNTANQSSHYFLNGALIKFQQIQTSGAAAPMATAALNGDHSANTNMLLKSPNIAATVPFTSKSLPLQQQQQQHHHQSHHYHQQSHQVQTQTFAAAATTAQYTHQPVFMATSSGLLLSTAMPTVITSQLSGLQTINQHSAMPALHQFNQTTGTILPTNITTILQNQQRQTTTTFVTSSPNQYHQIHHQQQHTPMLSNIPPALCNSSLQAKIAQSTFSTSICSSPQIFFTTTSMPSLITTSTPTTSITSSCMSPKESTPVKHQTLQAILPGPPPLISTLQSNPPPLYVPTNPTPPPLSKTHPPALIPTLSPIPKLEVTEVNAAAGTQVSITTTLSVDTATPTIAMATAPTTQSDKKSTKLCSTSLDLYSPTVPLLSPTEQLPQCLPSPKSLVLEKIQGSKIDVAEGMTEDETTPLPNRRRLFNMSNNESSEKLPSIETEFQTASLPECAKSPILQQPKTIRFPAVGTSAVSGIIRKSDGRIVGLCYWDNCDDKYDTSSKLLDHLQTQHVNSQSGPFTCQWSGCKVHGRESCSRRWLERHVLSHGGTKTFKCIFEGCGLRFGSQLALHKHVNGHLETPEPKDTVAKRFSDPPVPKKLRVTGKKLRYRRQPFSARKFDYFDGGIMEVLQHRLAHMATAATTSGDVIQFAGKSIGKRILATGIIEHLIEWSPLNIIPNEWTSSESPYFQGNDLSSSLDSRGTSFLSESSVSDDFSSSILSLTSSTPSITKSVRIKAMHVEQLIALKQYLGSQYKNPHLYTPQHSKTLLAIESATAAATTAASQSTFSKQRSRKRTMKPASIQSSSSSTSSSSLSPISRMNSS